MSFAIPSDFFADSEDDRYKVFAFRDETTMSVQVEETGGAKNRLTAMRRLPPSRLEEAKLEHFTLGDFVGDAYRYEKGEGFSMSIYAASSRAFYTIGVSSRNAKSPALEKFLYSLKFDDRAFIKRIAQANQLEEAAVAISIASLETSPAILEALKKKDAKDSKVTYDIGKKPEDDGDGKYSRALITLRKPRPSFTDSARQAAFQGTVKLKIVFRANGEIGDITVLAQLKKA